MQKLFCMKPLPLKLSYIAIVFLAGLSQSWAASPDPTEIYFVRHAETMSNFTGKYSLKHDRILSPHGKKQVQQLSQQLQQFDIDLIIVSPQPRALKTILPFLKKQRRTAEIWPSLDECCWQKKTPIYQFSQPQFGSEIELPTAIQAYFTFPDEHARFTLYSQTYNEGITQVQMAVDQLLRRFGNSGKHILVIGEYHAGTRFIEILQGLKPEGWYKLQNAMIIRLKENKHGHFILNSNI